MTSSSSSASTGTGNSNSNNNTTVTLSEFQIMDEADNAQIQAAESAVRQALAYSVRGKKQISYAGVKWLVLNMSHKDQPLEVVDLPAVELARHDPEDRSTWVWYAIVKIRNLRTGLVTVGASESPFLAQGEYDSFGRTKAISKAERNGYRKQIPETRINAMLEAVSSGDVDTLQTSSSSGQGGGAQQQQQQQPPQQKQQQKAASSSSSSATTATAKQLNYLKSLGYTGPTPATSQEASVLISEHLNKGGKDKEKPEGGGSSAQ